MKSYTYKQKVQEAKIEIAKTSLKEIGLLLRETREKQSLTVRDIRELTCIPINHILAIENGAREQLPEDLYLIGFIKRYAKAVNLDEKVICNKYSNQEKIKNYNEESDAFDLLFQEEKKQNVFDLKIRKQYLNNEVIEKKFLRVYHFYFFIGIVLFLIACYFMFQYKSEFKNDISVKKGDEVEIPISIEFEGNNLKNEEGHLETVHLRQDTENQKEGISKKLVKKAQEMQMRKSDKPVKIQKAIVLPKAVPSSSKLVDSMHTTLKNNNGMNIQQVLIRKEPSVSDTKNISRINELQGVKEIKNVMEVTKLRPLSVMPTSVTGVKQPEKPILRGLKTIH